MTVVEQISVVVSKEVSDRLKQRNVVMAKEVEGSYTVADVRQVPLARLTTGGEEWPSVKEGGGEGGGRLATGAVGEWGRPQIVLACCQGEA